MVQVHTQVWQHGCFKVVSKGGRGVMELQQSPQTLLLGCPLHGRAQAHRYGWHHGPQRLYQQHCHHFIRLLEHLCGSKILKKLALQSVSKVKPIRCRSWYCSPSHLAAPLYLAVPSGEQGVVEFRQLLIQIELALGEILPYTQQLALRTAKQTVMHRSKYIRICLCGDL